MKIKENKYLMILISICFIAFSCNSKNANEEKVIIENLSTEDAEIYKVATSFYEWYINYISIDNSDPKIDITSDSSGIHYLSNVEEYMNLLYSLETLSPKFLNKEKQRFIDCDCFLKTYDWSKFENTYDFDNTPCDFFTYKYWFKSQESADKVTVSSMERNNTNDTINVKLTFYVLDNTGEHKQYFSANETLVKLNGKWLIDEINVGDYCK